MATKPPPPTATVSGVVALLRQAPSRGQGRRSPVMIWMQQNREELETAFAQDTPAWKVIASYLGANGILNGDGRPPSPGTARSAWLRVKAEAKAKAQLAVALPVSAAPPAQVEPANAAAPVLAAVAPTTLPSPHPRFGGPATLRNHTPSILPAPPPPPMPTVPKQNPDDVIEAFLRRGRPSGLRKPEPQDE